MTIESKSKALYVILVAALASGLVFEVFLVGRLESNHQLSTQNLSLTDAPRNILERAETVSNLSRKAYLYLGLARTSHVNNLRLRKAGSDFYVNHRNARNVEIAEALQYAQGVNAQLAAIAESIESSGLQDSALEGSFDLGRLQQELSSMLDRGQKLESHIEAAGRRPALLQGDPPLSEEGFLEAASAFRQSSRQFARAVEDTVLALSSDSAQAARETRRYHFWTALLVGAFAALVGGAMLRSTLRLLRQLTAAAASVEKGDYDIRLGAKGSDEVARFARRFESMASKLAEYERMKRELQAGIAHDLKSPVSSMQQASQLMLEEDLTGPLTADQRELLELSLKNGQRVYSLILSMLELEKMEAGKMTYDFVFCDLRPLAASLVETEQLEARKRRIRLRADLPPDPVRAHCDVQRIEQVMGNLIGNALKFASEGGEVRLHLSSLSRFPRRAQASSPGGPAAVISVFDDGPGIPDESKGRIFDKFYQLNDGNGGASQGSGLGLAICRRIVEAHRGAIWVEDNPRGGSVFQVVLASRPLSQHPKGAPHSDSRSDGSAMPSPA